MLGVNLDGYNSVKCPVVTGFKAGRCAQVTGTGFLFTYRWDSAASAWQLENTNGTAVTFKATVGDGGTSNVRKTSVNNPDIFGIAVYTAPNAVPMGADPVVLTTGNIVIR